METSNKRILMAKLGKNIWDVLVWLALGYIVLWLILKVTGVINTPLWLQYSPLFGAVFVAGHLVQKLNRATKDIDEMKSDFKKDVSEIKQDFKVLNAEVRGIEKDVGIIKEKVK